jgi:signal transduction histidine kinase
MPLQSGGRLVVGEDIGDIEESLSRLTQALWMAMGGVLLLGATGGLLISRNVERSMGRLNAVVAAVREGDLKARAQVRRLGRRAGRTGARPERDAGPAGGLHGLDPPRRRRHRPRPALAPDADAGQAGGRPDRRRGGQGLGRRRTGDRLSEADHLLKTFNTVLAIARLQAGGAPDPQVFDAADLAADMAELYEPAAEDKGLEFSAEIERGLMVEGNQPFLAQALANVIDNAIKYTPTGGAVMLRARRRSSGEIEYSVTDTGPGVPAEDRERVVQRFVRLDNSRSEAGSGLGLSLVSAVLEAHAGRVQLDEGPGVYGGFGPGLRVALVLQPAP